MSQQDGNAARRPARRSSQRARPVRDTNPGGVPGQCPERRTCAARPGAAADSAMIGAQYHVRGVVASSYRKKTSVTTAKIGMQHARRCRACSRRSSASSRRAPRRWRDHEVGAVADVGVGAHEDGAEADRHQDARAGTPTTSGGEAQALAPARGRSGRWARCRGTTTARPWPRRTATARARRARAPRAFRMSSAGSIVTKMPAKSAATSRIGLEGEAVGLAQLAGRCVDTRASARPTIASSRQGAPRNATAARTPTSSTRLSLPATRSGRTS